MPAVQSKVNFENSSVVESGKSQTKNVAKTRHKVRSTSRRNDEDMEQNLRQKKKALVPKLDLSASPRPLDRQKSKLMSKQSKNPTPKTTTDAVPTSDSCLSEMETSRSLFSLSMVDVASLSPNQTPEDYFDCNEVDEYFRTQYSEFENALNFGYDTPTSSSMTSFDANNSACVFRHFKELLHQEEASRTNLLLPDEILLLKDIIKADERYGKLRRDDYKLLREILTCHLQEISQKERVIKIALKKIRNPCEENVQVTTLKVDSAEKPMECSQVVGPTPREEYEPRLKHPTSVRSSKKSQELEIIFKNVPSLEREIRILRMLGMKLEETLKKSSERSLTSRVLVLHEVQMLYIALRIHISCSIVHPRGVLVISGLAHEFQIRHQTIDELKLERDFYIPTDVENFTLQRMDFNKLSSHPELLLQRMKPFAKGSTMKFNLIEQDPMFFNHFLSKLCKVYSETSENHGIFIPKAKELTKQPAGSELCLHKNGSGDQPDLNKEQLHNLSIEKSQTASNSSMVKKRRKKHIITPMPSQKTAPTKNRFIRNILFGTLQLTALVTLATAIWYPDVACL